MHPVAGDRRGSDQLGLSLLMGGEPLEVAEPQRLGLLGGVLRRGDLDIVRVDRVVVVLRPPASTFSNGTPDGAVMVRETVVSPG